MTQIKICPKCRCEFYPHMTECSDCGVPLIFPEELKGKAAPMRDASGDEWVEMGKDARGWVEELSEMLSSHGVPSRMESEGGCKPGSCGTRYLLMVPESEAKKAAGLIEEYYVRMHPEAGQAGEWAAQGKCPACGHSVAADETECPDCGLALDVEP